MSGMTELCRIIFTNMYLIITVITYLCLHKDVFTYSNSLINMFCICTILYLHGHCDQLEWQKTDMFTS